MIIHRFSEFVFFPGHLRPRTHVSDSALIARDHNFCSFQDCRSIFHPRTAYPPSSGLRVDEFSRAAVANRHRKPAEYADHFEVGGIKVLVRRTEDAGQEQINNGPATGAAQQRDSERSPKPNRGMPGQQIPRASEPGQERGERDQVKWGDLRPVSAMCPCVCMASGMDVDWES